MNSDHLDLPELKKIKMGSQAFRGDNDNSRKGKRIEPFNWKNSLTMIGISGSVNTAIDLPELSVMIGNTYNFQFFGKVTLESSYCIGVYIQIFLTWIIFLI